MMARALAHVCSSSDPFARKEWYDIKAPAVFTNRQVGKTVVNKTQGQSTSITSSSRGARVG